MGLKTILLLMMVVHKCTGESDASSISVRLAPVDKRMKFHSSALDNSSESDDIFDEPLYSGENSGSGVAYQPYLYKDISSDDIPDEPVYSGENSGSGVASRNLTKQSAKRQSKGRSGGRKESAKETVAKNPKDQTFPDCSPYPACKGNISGIAVKTSKKKKQESPNCLSVPKNKGKHNKENKNLSSKNKSKTKKTAHPCNSTDLGAVNYSKTTKNMMTFSILGDAVLFLKGLLVTRVMPSFYILLFLISLPLNALALVTFTCKIKEKKPAVIYMSNLACVDLLFTLLLPLKIHYQLNGSHWVFGEVACRVLSAAFYCYMYCSILLMMCMSVDRLLAVVFPVASLTWRTTRNSAYICALVWLLALAGTVPLLSITQTYDIEHVGMTCHDALRHDDPADQTYMYLFSILSCLYFFLPLIITLVCYSTIIYALNIKSGRLVSSISDKRRRAVIMTIATMIEFVVCFAATNAILLYHCVVLVTGGIRGEGNASYMAYMLAVCAGSSSVFLDPLLYYYGSSQCRQQIRSVFWWKKTKRDTKISNTAELCLQKESCLGVKV